MANVVLLQSIAYEYTGMVQGYHTFKHYLRDDVKAVRKAILKMNNSTFILFDDPTLSSEEVELSYSNSPYAGIDWRRVYNIDNFMK